MAIYRKRTHSVLFHFAAGLITFAQFTTCKTCVKLTGTIVNTATIIAGSLIGVAIHSRLPRKTVDVVFQGIGLFTLGLGISMSLRSDNMLLSVISIVTGAIIGQWLQIDKRLDRLSAFLLKLVRRGKAPVAPDETFDRTVIRASSGPANFSEGFITATMIFCIGSMSVLGAIEDGTGQVPNLLYTKSIMDGITSVVLASSFGIAIMLSAVPVLLYQGILTLLAFYVSRFMSDVMVADLTSVGGILLIGLAINILKIKDINIVNMLPSLVIILILSYFWG